MAGYLGASPVPQSILKKESKTLTANQTTVNTSGYTHGGSISVTLNGVLLEGAGVDYTATNGSDIVLTAGATAGDARSTAGAGGGLIGQRAERAGESSCLASRRYPAQARVPGNDAPNLLRCQPSLA